MLGFDHESWDTRIHSWIFNPVDLEPHLDVGCPWGGLNADRGEIQFSGQPLAPQVVIDKVLGCAEIAFDGLAGQRSPSDDREELCCLIRGLEEVILVRCDDGGLEVYDSTSLVGCRLDDQPDQGSDHFGQTVRQSLENLVPCCFRLPVQPPIS
ncbi:hypothetical protein CRM73_01840 [Kocuria sp. CCUG 69068]|nr:hypothetical protein [Kocuria sp. CCUG 69068]